MVELIDRIDKLESNPLTRLLKMVSGEIRQYKPTNLIIHGYSFRRLPEYLEIYRTGFNGLLGRIFKHKIMAIAHSDSLSWEIDLRDKAYLRVAVSIAEKMESEYKSKTRIILPTGSVTGRG